MCQSRKASTLQDWKELGRLIFRGLFDAVESQPRQGLNLRVSADMRCETVLIHGEEKSLADFLIRLLIFAMLPLQVVLASRPDNVQPSGLSLGLLGSPEQTARIELRRLCEGESCQSYIIYDGTINQASLKEFNNIASSQEIGTIVLLNSAEGDLTVGMQLGRLIRDLRFNSRVGRADADQTTPQAGNCYSTCALAFLGGGIRRIPEESKYGFYPLRSAQEKKGNLDEKTLKSSLSMIGQYIAQMGVDIRLLKMILEHKDQKLSVVNQVNLRLLNVDNSITVSLSKWSLQALGNGSLIATVSEKNSLGTVLVTIGLNRLGNKFICTVFIRPISAEVSPVDLVNSLNKNKIIKIRNKDLELARPLDNWSLTASGMRANFSLTEVETERLIGQPDFILDLRNNLDAHIAVQKPLTFGTSGLKGALMAIKK